MISGTMYLCWALNATIISLFFCRVYAVAIFVASQCVSGNQYNIYMHSMHSRMQILSIDRIWILKLAFKDIYLVYHVFNISRRNFVQSNSITMYYFSSLSVQIQTVDFVNISINSQQSHCLGCNIPLSSFISTCIIRQSN